MRSRRLLILAIALANWVQYARTVRGSTMVEKSKEYVQAARVTGVAPLRIMSRHVLPNVMGPVLVLATIQVAETLELRHTLARELERSAGAEQRAFDFGQRQHRRGVYLRTAEPAKKMAERVGFEPTVHLLGGHTISSRAPSAARSPLRIR